MQGTESPVVAVDHQSPQTDGQMQRTKATIEQSPTVDEAAVGDFVQDLG